MSIRKQMAHGMLWVLLEKAGQQVLNLFVFLLVARLIGPEEIGLAGLCAIFASLALVITFGLVDAVISQRLTDDRSLSTLFWPVLGSGVVLSLVTYFSAQPFAALMGDQRLNGLLRSMAIVPLLFATSAVPTALIQARLEFRVFAIRALVSTVVGGAVGVYLALKGYGAYALIYQQVTKLLLGNIILWPSARWRPRLILDTTILPKLLSPGMKLTGTYLVSFLEEQVPRILIGLALGSRFVGFYFFAHRLFQSLRELMIMPILIVLFPALAKIKDDQGNVRRMVGQTTFITGILVLPSLIGAATLAPLFVPLFFGEKWQAAVPMMQLLFVAMIPSPFVYIIRDLLRALEVTGLFLRIQIVMTGLNLLVISLLVGQGLEVMVAGIMVANFAVFPFVVRAASKKSGIPLFHAFRGLGAILVACLVMVGGILAFQHSPICPENPWLNLAASLVGGALLYAGVLAGLQYRRLKTMSTQVLQVLRAR